MKLFRFLLLLVFSGIAWAHPHIFVEAWFALELETPGQERLEVWWELDEMSSMSLDDKETGQVREEWFGALGESRDFFTAIRLDGVQTPTPEPERFAITVEQNKARFHFVFPLSQEAAASKALTIGCYDPDYFMDIIIRTERNRILPGEKNRPAVEVVQETHDYFVAEMLRIRRNP